MPAVQIAGFPTYPRHSQTVTLGGKVLRLTFTWRARTASWYVDFRQADGTAIALGRRLSPGWSPVAGLRSDALPDGVFLVFGPDDYERNDLGTALRLVYLPTEDLPEQEADPDARTVVIL